MPCPGPFNFSHSLDYIYEFCPLTDPDVDISIFVCDVEHTSFHVKKIIFSYWTLYGDILYDVGKVLYKYCTSTFPISTLTIMFMYIMWWYIYEYHS